VIARNGVPAARLVPVTAAYAPVRLGVLAGEAGVFALASLGE
jgi:antitoxin (DNA-binding transcriptional repressor) of toxin-antitoxin stability system